MTSYLPTAEPEQIPDAVAVLSVAFAHDPVLSFLFPDPVTRPGLLATFFAARLAAGVGMDLLYLSEQNESASLWLPPLQEGDLEPSWDAVLAATIALMGEEETMQRFAALEPMIEAKPKEPHWYLGFVGTRSESRGKGLGSALIKVITDRCDVEGMPAALESSDPVNVPLYERHGFRVTQVVEIIGGPSVPMMWRDPA